MVMPPLPAELRAAYPFESHWFDRGGGIRLHHLDEGEGPPVVMLHGNPTWSFHFRTLVSALRATHRCIVPDHVGMGLSDKPADAEYAYTLGTRVDDLEQLLDHLDVTVPVTLVLQDWGGMIGAAWALRRAGRVARLVVLNTAAFLLPQTRAFHWQLGFARSVVARPLMLGLGGFTEAALRTCVLRPGRMNDSLRAAYRWPHRTWQERRAVLRFVEDIPLTEGDPAWAIASEVDRRIGEISKLPTLVAWGGQDFVFDGHFLAEWRKRFPKAEIHELPDCGHWVLEDATEEIVGWVKEFLGRGYPGAP
jgi:haloalkane dehalogenase